MQSTAQHTARWAVLMAIAGLVVAVVVYVLTNDVVWTIVPLLLTVAAVRGLLRRGRTSR